MTPNLDEELEAEIDEVLVDMTNVCNDCEHPKCLAQLKAGRKRIMHLIKSREERLVREARVDIIMKVFSAKTEGLFDNGNLFIKRRPIEQVIINELGYETYKAIQEAIDALEEGE